MMTKSEILKNLEAKFKEVGKFVQEFPETHFFKRIPSKKWSVAENVEHLFLTIKPLVGLFGNPDYMLTKWGKSNRASRTYNEVVELYFSKIGHFGVTTKHYEPQKIEIGKDELIQNFLSMNKNLLEKIASLSEDDLDNYQIPHPLLGLMTCKEFLYFTHHHAVRHLETLKNISIVY
jgi:hypothetical protein